MSELQIIKIKPPEPKDNINTHPEWQEGNYERWKTKQYKKIGYTGDKFIFTGGDGLKEFTWFRGALYKRDCDPYYEHVFFFKEVDSEEKSPDVLCSCGNTKFNLEYGNYCMIAICMECGKQGVVYSE